MSVAGSRTIAAAALAKLDGEGGFSNRVLSEVLDRHPGLAGRDRGFVTALFYGVLRHRSRLDALIDSVAKDPKRLPSPARLACRIGALELREMGQPPHAAISEAVGLVKASHGGPRLAPVVQAILSRIDREGDALDAALATGKPLDVLARRHSIPRWWAGRLLKHLGTQRALARAEAFAQTPNLELRVDLQRTTRQAVIDQLNAEVPDAKILASDRVQTGVSVHGGGDLFHTPLHEKGLISVQSLASQSVVAQLSLGPGRRVLDACAGMGVKTLQIAEALHRSGTIIANDPDGGRQRAAAEIVQRGDLPPDMVTFTTHDVASDWPEQFDGQFDAVVVDAPCTGLGNVGRHPEIRWQRNFEDIAQNAARQQAILRNALRGLRPGAQLVYAVCSLEPEEGPDVVDAVVDGGAAASQVRRGQWTPEDDGGEGFFWAVLTAPPG